MSHSEFEELAAGYVLGALEPDDEHDFQRHLGGCATCEANVRELEAVVGGLAAAAAILMVAVLSVWNLSLRDENAAIRDRVAALERATQLANDPNASLVTMDEVPGPEGAQATVIASSRQDRGVLLIESLPPLARDRVYELWGVPQGDIDQAQKALVFVPLRRQGVQALEFEVPIQPGTVFAITDEPGPDGSEKPTSQPLLVGAPPSA